ncbi:cytochrome P450 [Mycena crocata]|nr:cytochrome P450 [Mycena crocata]
MLLSPVAFAACVTVVCALWRAIRLLTRKSVLDNIPGPPSRSKWTGNFLTLFDPQGWEFHNDIANKYGGISRIDGPGKSKMLYVFDPLALYNITVKDQPLYDRSNTSLLAAQLLFGEGLLSIEAGTQHRKQRKMLNPVFNVVHLRQLAPIFYEVTHKLRAALTSKAAHGSTEVDIHEWLARTAVELIGQGGLGFSFDRLTDNPDDPVHPYSNGIRGMQSLLMRLTLAFKFILPWARKIGTPRIQRAVISATPWETLHEFRDTVDIMDDTTRQVYNEKKRALSNDDKGALVAPAGGKDIISILMKENLRADADDRLSDSEVTLIFAAAETTSSGLAKTLQLLAENPEIQDRLRTELTDAQESSAGDIPYDKLMQLQYLDAVCRETLRLHPPAPIFIRTTRADVVLPLAHPIRGLDGAQLSAVPIPRGTDIVVSIYAANRNPRLWGLDATVWKPSRWLEPLQISVNEARLPGIYQNQMTFSAGPRACIGFKFAQLEMKVVLAVLLTRFRVSVAEGEVIWDLGFVVSPRLRGGKEPEMPLVLTLLKGQ